MIRETFIDAKQLVLKTEADRVYWKSDLNAELLAACYDRAITAVPNPSKFPPPTPLRARVHILNGREGVGVLELVEEVLTRSFLQTVLVDPIARRNPLPIIMAR